MALSLAALPAVTGLLPACSSRHSSPEASGDSSPRGHRRSRPGRTRAGGPDIHTDSEPPLLTETVGLLMQYAADRGDRDIFDAQHSRVLHHLRSWCGLVSWRATPDLMETANSSASIDDLTVVRALLDGAERWNDSAALDLAVDIGRAVMRYQVIDGHLVDAASWTDDEVTPSSAVQTAYLAVDVMERLTPFEPRWSEVAENSISLLSRLESAQGLYPEEVTLSQALSPDSYGVPDTTTNAILVLYSALHLATVKRGGKRTLDHLKRRWAEGASLAGRYSFADGTPVDGYECVAVYGLASRLARALGSVAFSDALIERMLAYQFLDPVVARPAGPLPHRDTTPFDNLQALLALVAATERVQP